MWTLRCSLQGNFLSRLITFIFANLAEQQIHRWIKKTVERVHCYKFNDTRSNQTGKNLPFSTKMADMCFQTVGSSAITCPTRQVRSDCENLEELINKSG